MARLVQKGTNINRLAREWEVPASTLYQAARGTRRGVETIKVRNRLLNYAYAKN